VGVKMEGNTEWGKEARVKLGERKERSNNNAE
jgi:hypothetical protein